MADLIDTIQNAVADVEQGTVPDPVAGEDTGGDSGGDVETSSGDTGGGDGSTSDEAVSPSSRLQTADEPTVPAAPPPPPVDELTKELESFGMKAPTEGKEGRFRWGQVRKVVENTRKKLNDQHQQAIRVRDAQLAEVSERVKNMDAVDQLIVNDPERYLTILASLHPDKYSKYVGRGQAPAPAAPTYGEQPPGPDAQFSDGSRGYSPEGLQALMEWQAQRVTAQVTEQVEQKYAARFGPIEQEWKQTRAEAEFEKKHVPIVRSQIATARETWGKPFTDHEAEIVKVMAENDGQQGRPYLSFDAAIAKVLVPKQRASRDKVRREILDEINGRPAAAAHTGGPAPQGNGATGARSTEDVIRAAIAASGLR